MALYDANVSPGLGMAAEYKAAGIPVVGTLTPGQTATFTKVTKAITFNSFGPMGTGGAGAAPGEVDISFDGGSTTFKFGGWIDSDASMNLKHRVEVKCTTFTNMASSDADVHFIAELTNIDAEKCLDWDFADFCSIT